MVLERNAGSRKTNENNIKTAVQLYQHGRAKETSQYFIKNTLRSLDVNNR